MSFTVEYEQESDGRWLAEVLELSGVMAYGKTSDEAIAKAQTLALRVLADRLEHGEGAPEFLTSPLLQHESVVICQSAKRVLAGSPRWLDSQTRIKLSQDPLTAWLAGRRICLP